MATCIRCGRDMGDKDGSSICEKCVAILLSEKTPSELLALAKVGLDALVDETTGYQKIRPKGELKKRHKKYEGETE